MNESTIFVFALVLAVVASVAAVWITWLSRTAMLRLSLDWRDVHLKVLAEVKRIEGAVEKTTNSKLAAEVDALRGALDVYRASTRKELGALWGRIGGRGATIDSYAIPAGNGAYSGDPELDELLRLQSAKPAGPGNEV